MIPGLGGVPGLTAPATAGAGGTGVAAKTLPAEDSLSELFGTMVGNTVTRLENAEQVSMQALKGDADTRMVVDAVMNAEQSLQTAIAIRDKIVSAYLDISRMAI